MLFISLTLVIVLMGIVPAPALAAKPVSFFAAGWINDITPGNVVAAGDSGRYRVIERELSGYLNGSIQADFTMTYKANVELETQAGNFHGIVTAGPYILKVNGKIEPLEFVAVGPYFLPKLTFNGHGTFTEGAQGQGEIHGWAVFIPTGPEDPEGPGHVKQILYSSFTLSGEWQQ